MVQDVKFLIKKSKFIYFFKTVSDIFIKLCNCPR